MHTDKKLIDWLEKGHGYGLISDNNGHWTVCGCGFQDILDNNSSENIQTTFIVFEGEWKNSIREAIIAAIEEEESINQLEIDFDDKSLEK